MIDEKKTVPGTPTENHQQPLSLFDMPTNPANKLEAYEASKFFLNKISLLERKLDQILDRLKKKEINPSSSTILNNADFVQLFKISGKTAQNWRDEGLINYFQVKGKIYYKLEDVEHLLSQSRK